LSQDVGNVSLFVSTFKNRLEGCYLYETELAWPNQHFFQMLYILKQC